jgi:nitrate/TMAO reductase-like tetraheme cytochrome c subunit
MAQQETGKQRASRIPLDYYKRPDRLATWKSRLTILALALVVLYLAGGWALGTQGEQRFSHGPVASVHQAWENRCETCHVPFQPIKQDSFLTPYVHKPMSSDAHCQACHSGPPHHKDQLMADTVSCGSCHRDHRGREASLVNLPDSDCTSCHADLKKHQAHDTTIHFQNVSSFSLQGHPDFAPNNGKQSDPGRIKFNHQLHLTPGLTLKQTLSQIKDDSERERYRLAQPDDQRKPTDEVVLNCASCHRLDSRDGQGQSGLPARSKGDLMLPVAYETSCKACHLLTFDTTTAAIPHHLQPAQVRSFVWGELAKQKIKSMQVPQGIPLPGKPLGELEMKLKDEINRETNTVETFLYKGDVDRKERYLYSGKTTCGECHETNNRKPEKIVPPQADNVWLPHARFDHSAHRAVKCEDCHQPDTKTSAKDMTLPGITNCLQCHAPATTVNGKPQGGVRFNCTECHRYHHGQDPLKGNSGSERDPRHKRDIEAFLSGTTEH